MTRKRLSNVDTAWIRMDVPTNLMMVNGVLILGAPIDYDRLKATLEKGILRFDRFRQRVVQSVGAGGGLYWEDDPDFDLSYHLQRATLPPPGDQAALQQLTSLLASSQLDPARPLWQLHLVEQYGPGCAVICRLHHAIGDGMALVYVLLSLADTGPDSPWPVLQAGELSWSGEPRVARPPVRQTLKRAAQATRHAVRQGKETVVHPRRCAHLARTGVRGAAAAARLALRWPDPGTPFKGSLGVEKRTTWSAPLPLDDIKAVGRGLGGTVNDVLLTAMAGGLRRYLSGRGEPVAGLNFRGIVPVNLRPPGTESDLGNRFGLVFLSLPVGLADPGNRLRELKRRMDGLKGSLEAPAAFAILKAMGLSPMFVQDVLVDIFEKKGTLVMTNVMGPRQPLYLAGAPLETLMFWVPQAGRLGIGVSILSYAGRVWLGVMTDAGLVPDPEAIIAGFHAEFDDLLARVRAPDRARAVPRMSAALDGALATLDAALAEQRGGSPTMEAAVDLSASSPARCQALTRAGQACKNPPLAGSSTCRVHQSQQ